MPVISRISSTPNCDEAVEHRLLLFGGGNSACWTSGNIAPSSDGPSTRPAISIPITAGCFSRSSTSPSSRPTSSSTTNSQTMMASEAWPSPPPPRRLRPPPPSAAQASAPPASSSAATGRSRRQTNDLVDFDGQGSLSDAEPWNFSVGQGRSGCSDGRPGMSSVARNAIANYSQQGYGGYVRNRVLASRDAGAAAETRARACEDGWRRERGPGVAVRGVRQHRGPADRLVLDASSWRSSGPAIWSRSATWTRATGRPRWPAARSSATRC